MYRTEQRSVVAWEKKDELGRGEGKDYKGVGENF